MKLNNNDDSHNSGLNLLIYNMLLDIGHTLRGCVDWNWKTVVLRRATPRSHPAWVCGLKPYILVDEDDFPKSHPAWVCGLKRLRHWNGFVAGKSHPAWVCGLKHFGDEYHYYIPGHTLRGCVDWNNSFNRISSALESHTLRGCVDWNHYWIGIWQVRAVTPCVGVWIETGRYDTNLIESGVTPCVGVWIETYIDYELKRRALGHTLRGCVDWNWGWPGERR